MDQKLYQRAVQETIELLIVNLQAYLEFDIFNLTPHPAHAIATALVH